MEENTNVLLSMEEEKVKKNKFEFFSILINYPSLARCDANCNVDVPSSPKPEKPSTPGAEKKPIILEQLKDQKVVEGNAVVFKAKATGKPIPTAQWFKGDKIIKPSKYFQMTKEREYYTLKISEAFPEDEGPYKCVLKNLAGESTTSAKLTVVAPELQDALPKITPLKDVIVTEGQPAKFTTTHTSKTKVTVHWFREGKKNLFINLTHSNSFLFYLNSRTLDSGVT